MTKVTEKNTKKEILEALKEAEAKLADLRTARTTTADKVKAQEVETKKENAKELVEMNILNDGITAKYNDLLSTIQVLEGQIESLHEVKVGLDTLEALAITHENQKTTFEDEMAAKELEQECRLQAKKAEEEARIQGLKESYYKMKIELETEHAELKSNLAKDRKREKEEYSYNLTRERARENDAWEDEKAAREKELADRETAVTERETTVNKLEATVIGLELEIDNIKEESKAAIALALKEGEAKAEKTCAIKMAGVQKEAEWQKKVSNDKIESLTAQLAGAKDEITKLNTDLKEAYARIQEMAIAQANSNQPRIVETSK